jgi:formamidopyrimidine-DNA glycosylase
MPELPDLVVIVRRLNGELHNPKITEVRVREPIVIRMLVPGSFPDALTGKRLAACRRHGPFLTWDLSPLELIIHFMLAGRLYLEDRGKKTPPYTCFSLFLESGKAIHYADNRKMGKIYVVEAGDYASLPGYREQGVDITGPAFTRDLFRELIEGRRHQVRVFLMDQKRLSAIGNAYADEILFEAGIHPKTLCSQLDADKVDRLYESVCRVIPWGIRNVAASAGSLDQKVRDHMRVRNRKGKPCPRCGTTIRRTAVLGYDSFFCPRCQPTTRKSLVPWGHEPAAD